MYLSTVKISRDMPLENVPHVVYAWRLGSDQPVHSHSLTRGAVLLPKGGTWRLQNWYTCIISIYWVLILVDSFLHGMAYQISQHTKLCITLLSIKIGLDAIQIKGGFKKYIDYFRKLTTTGHAST